MYIKLNFQLSDGENSPLEPYKNKGEAQRDTGSQLKDSISVNEKALCTHLPDAEGLLTYRGDLFIGHTEYQATRGGDAGRKVTFMETLSQPGEVLSAICKGAVHESLISG